MSFDPNRRDLMEMKDHLGKTTLQEVFNSMEGIGQAGLTDEAMETMYFMAFICRRKANPETTLEETYELRLSELKEVIGLIGPLTEEASSAIA